MRLRADQTLWHPDAVLRPGLGVRIIDIGPFGALVESGGRLRPGRHAVLHLTDPLTARSLLVAGQVARCVVVRLDPLAFRGALAFDPPRPELASRVVVTRRLGGRPVAGHLLPGLVRVAP